MKWLLALLLAILSISRTAAFSPPKAWPPDASIITKPSPPKGDGVFAAESISAAAFVCQYHGRLLTLEQHDELYPDTFSDYCLRIGKEQYIDGQRSKHWSRLINHNEKGNLRVHANAEKRHAFFTAARDIVFGEELSFDYGVTYFIARGLAPAPGTESRNVAPPKQITWDTVRADAPPKIPRSNSEIRDLLMNDNENEESKKTSLLRGLDFYGIVWDDNDQDMLRLPVGFVPNEDGDNDSDLKYREFSYSTITSQELAGILETLRNETQ